MEHFAKKDAVTFLMSAERAKISFAYYYTYHKMRDLKNNMNEMRPSKSGSIISNDSHFSWLFYRENFHVNYYLVDL